MRIYFTGKNLPGLMAKIIIAGFVCLSFALSANAQSDSTEQTREITSDDFASQRPAAQQMQTNKGGTKSAPARRARYNFVRWEKSPARRKSGNPRPARKNAQPVKVSQVGVTIWRLRPPRKSDAGPKIPTQMPNGSRQMWTPERVGANAVFRAGDKVRLAVESSAAGYLYVVNSEIYSDGSLGDPYLIFPAVIGEDNSVRPGLLVEFPDQSEDLPYFTINPKREDYAGELLTVIISPQRLVNLKTDAHGRIVNVENLAEFEENTEIELYAKADGAGEIYTKAEAEAVCDQKTRQLERSKPQPCANTRQLTREESLPQTLYRIKTFAGQSSVLFVRMNVEQ